MKTNAEFFQSARAAFPEIAEKADRQHIAYWDEAPRAEHDSYSWFESVARALNVEMKQGTYLPESQSFFQFVADVFEKAEGAEVKICIDVAFVENLFWQVAPKKLAPYWHALPPALKKLYVEFHARPPL